MDTLTAVPTRRRGAGWTLLACYAVLALLAVWRAVTLPEQKSDVCGDMCFMSDVAPYLILAGTVAVEALGIPVGLAILRNLRRGRSAATSPLALGLVSAVMSMVIAVGCVAAVYLVLSIGLSAHSSVVHSS